MNKLQKSHQKRQKSQEGLKILNNYINFLKVKHGLPIYEKENMRKEKEMKSTIVKRIASVFLAAVVLVTTVHVPVVHAEVDVPVFGNRKEDWDYNRIKQIGRDSVYALNHNEYMEYKMFSPIKFQGDSKTMNLMYFEFSYPYTCKADIQLYKFSHSEYEKLIKSGEVVDAVGMQNYFKNLNKNMANYLGNIVGRTLKNHVVEAGETTSSRRWPLGVIEGNLRNLTFDPINRNNELKKVSIYGNTGEKAGYYSLESYYEYNGIEASQTMSLKTESALTDVSGGDAVIKSITFNDNYSVASVSDNDVLADERQELTVTVSSNDFASDIPEDFYITEKKSSDTKIMARGAIMPASMIHNYIVWNGTYVDRYKQVKRLEDGVYILVIQPVGENGSEITSLAKLRTYLPFVVGEPTMTGPNGEEVAKVQKEIYGDRMLYITLAMAMGGDPVDLVTGSLEWSYTDMTLEGALPLSFTRSYSSIQADNPGPLGYGWTHNYNYRLESFYGTVSITLPNGTRMDFVQDYDGTYAKAPGSAYSLENIDGGYLLSNTDGTTIRFDGTGLPVEMKDIHGNVTTLGNDGSHITSIATNSGNLNLSYSGDLITALTDHAGRSVIYTYSGSDLASVTNPDGDSMTCGYDGSHNLTYVTGFTGEEMLKNTYNGEHQVVSQTLPDLGTYTYSYDKAGRTTTHTAENGLSQTIEYDEKNRIIKECKNDGIIYYTYDDLSRRVSETDRKGNQTAYTYAGDTTNVETITYPDGTMETYTYNAKNQPTSKKQKCGTLLAFTYDANGNLTKYTDARGGSYTYEYDSNNYCTKETDPLGNVTTYTYNQAGCPLSMTDSLGNTTTYTYDSVGRILSETSPEGKTTSYSYTSGGKLVTVTDAAGNSQTYEYTGNGFATKETDKQGNAATYVYSAMNRMNSAIDREGNKTLYTYDKNGKVASETDAEGNRKAYTYDHEGRKVSSTDGNGNTSTFTYDGNGNLTESTTAEGNKNSYTYDSMDRLIGETDANGGTESYTYDSMGRVKTITDGEGGVTTYSYDANGNLTSVVNARGYETTYAYDSANRLTSVKDALGAVTTYSYDANGRCIL